MRYGTCQVEGVFERSARDCKLVLAISSRRVWSWQKKVRQHVDKLLATSGTCLYSRGVLRCVVWKHAFLNLRKFANFSLSCERVCRVTLTSENERELTLVRTEWRVRTDEWELTFVRTLGMKRDKRAKDFTIREHVWNVNLQRSLRYSSYLKCSCRSIGSWSVC